MPTIVNQAAYIRAIMQSGNNRIMSQMLADLIEQHKGRLGQMRKLYREYTGDVPIHKRRAISELRRNNKLANDYRGDIIDTQTGYLFGTPLTYSIDKVPYLEEPSSAVQYEQGKKPLPVVGPGYQAAKDKLDTFMKVNSMDALDTESGKKAAICGYAVRYLYFKQGDEIPHAVDVPPWECIFVNDAVTDEPQYAMRFYTVEDFTNKGSFANIRTEPMKRIRVEWYDAEFITFYISDDSGNFVPDYTRPEAVQPIQEADGTTREPTANDPVRIAHMFDLPPLVQIKNNPEMLGDFEKVATLIDGYDRLVSDAQNELEEFRAAYMTITKARMDSDTIEEAKRTGVFSLPEGASMDYLVKELNGDFLEKQKDTLDENIYKFSKTPNMADQAFGGGGESGEARQWKLLGLSNRATIKKQEFSKGLRRMFAVLCSAWNKGGVTIDPLALYWEFHPNIPKENSSAASVVNTLWGKVSKTTLLGLLPFVDDAEWELQQIDRENDGIPTVTGSEDDDTGDNANAHGGRRTGNLESGSKDGGQAGQLGNGPDGGQAPQGGQAGAAAAGGQAGSV